MSTNKQNISSDVWITQAEAARLRGVSRQAINKLIKKGRIKTLEISSVIFIDKSDLQNYKPKTSGRPKRKENG